MQLAGTLLIEVMIVSLSAALGAALALLRWQRLPAENFAKRRESPGRALPFIWLGN